MFLVCSKAERKQGCKYEVASALRPRPPKRMWLAVVFGQHHLAGKSCSYWTRGGGLKAIPKTLRRHCARPDRETRMKRILIASALALATAAPAFAADLPPAAAPPPRAPVAYIPAAPVFSWTGFYVGLNAGGAFGNSSWTTPVGSVGSFSTIGALFGGQIGGNYQIGQFVIGAEGDFD